MPKMTPGELKALLAAERYSALSAMTASKLSDERATALNYYYGDMSKDMPAPEGRSRAVSTDVADTVEGLMPTLMEIFCGGDEVVRFEPVGPEDVAAAEQETDYVNHVFMQGNPGFVALYSFIKDALISKVGVVKVWWEEREETERETYLDLDDATFAVLAADPDVEIVEHTEHAGPAGASSFETRPAGAPQDEAFETAATRPPQDEGEGPAGMGAPRPEEPAQPASRSLPPTVPAPAGIGGAAAAPDQAAGPTLHDVTVQTRRTYSQARVMGVAPEEFGISRYARSIRDTEYCFHDVFKTQSKLIAEGFDPDQVKKLPSYTMAHTIEEIARDTVNESTLRQSGEAMQEAGRLIRVTEHYIRMDYEGELAPAPDRSRGQAPAGEARLYRVTTAGEEGEVLERDGAPDIVPEDMIPFAAMTPVIVTHRFFGRSIADLVLDIQRIKTALLRGALDNLYLHNNPRVEVAESFASETTLDDLLVSRPGGIVRTKQPGGLNWQVVPDITATVYPALQYFDATREWRTGVSRQGQGVDPNALQNQVATIANQMFNAAQAKVKLIARIFAETGIRDLFTLLHAVIRKHGSEPQTVRLRNQWVTVDPRDWRKRDDMTVNVGLGTGTKTEQLAHLQMIVAAQKEAVMGGVPIVSTKNLYNSAKELAKLAGFKNVDLFFTPPGAPADPSDAMSAPLSKPPDPKQAEIAAKAKAEQDKLAADAAHQQMRMKMELTLEQQRFELEKQLKLLDAQLKAEQHRQALTINAVKAAGEPGPDGQPAANHAPVIAAMMETLHRMSLPKRVVRDAQGRVSHIEVVQ